MKGLGLFGDYVLEILVISLLVAVSAVLIVPFVPVLVGVTAFFKTDINTRRFKDVFTAIASNYKILIFYTVFQLAIIIFPVLNIYYFNTHPQSMNYFILAVSYFTLTVGAIYLATAPTIIVNMQVTANQLIFNGITLLFGGLVRSIAALACVGGVVALIIIYPYCVPLTLYPAPYLTARLMKENFYVLKAKSLKTSVYELKKREKDEEEEKQ